MTLYVGRSGRRYESGSQIARGGEGTIFTIIGDPYHVLKIYRDEKIQNKESKILAMCKHPVSQSVDTQIMWPKDVVYDYGEFKGFVMNKIDEQAAYESLKLYEEIIESMEEEERELQEANR